MYSTPVYLYTVRQLVVLLMGDSPRRYEKVYSKQLTLNRGVDNKIQFQFINQEQKPVNLAPIIGPTGTLQQITCRVLNYNGTQTLIQKALEPQLPYTGIMYLTVTSEELRNIDPQQCWYSLEIPMDGFDMPVFVDADGGARGVMRIVDSVLPSFLPSKLVTIPSHPPPQAGTNQSATPNQPSNRPPSVLFDSSVINTKDSPALTLQTFYADFTGTSQVMGSTDGVGNWYPIGPLHTFVNQVRSTIETVEGYHPFVKVVYYCTNGDINHILAR